MTDKQNRSNISNLYVQGTAQDHDFKRLSVLEKSLLRTHLIIPLCTPADDSSQQRVHLWPALSLCCFLIKMKTSKPIKDLRIDGSVMSLQ